MPFAAGIKAPTLPSNHGIPTSENEQKQKASGETRTDIKI